MTIRNSSVNSAISFRTALETSTATNTEGGFDHQRPNLLESHDLDPWATGTTMVNRTTSPAAKYTHPLSTRLRRWLRPSKQTIYTTILCTSEGMTCPFAVMASLMGVSDARLIMLAGLTELIAGAISVGASGILVANSHEERHQAEIRCTIKQIEKNPDDVSDCFTTSLASDLPASIISDITTHCQTLPIREKVALIMRFRQDPPPCPVDTYKAAITFFLTSFSGLPTLIPYIAVRKDQVDLAFYISTAIMTGLSFTCGWATTGYNVGWTGLGNVAKCVWGGLKFFGAVAAAAVLSVVIIRGIDHHL